MTDLTVRLSDITLRSAVMTAAGCAGTGRELARFVDLSQLGAFVTRSVTRDPDNARMSMWMQPTPSGFVHGVRPPSAGLEAFLTRELPWLQQQRVRPIVSLVGTALGEYAESARRLGQIGGVSAVEVNLDTVLRDGDGQVVGDDPFTASRVVGTVRHETPRGVPVLAKLTWGGDPLRVVQAVGEAGADALVLMAPPPARTVPTGGGAARRRGRAALSGDALRPLVLDRVWRVHAAYPSIPLVAVGGVRTGHDALEMLLAGARAVQVGTAMFRDPVAAVNVHRDLRRLLEDRGVDHVHDVVGAGHVQPAAAGYVPPATGQERP